MILQDTFQTFQIHFAPQKYALKTGVVRPFNNSLISGKYKKICDIMRVKSLCYHIEKQRYINPYKVLQYHPLPPVRTAKRENKSL